jgi:hypothetical protein
VHSVAISFAPSSHNGQQDELSRCRAWVALA